jgi:uncharacterized protein
MLAAPNQAARPLVIVCSGMTMVSSPVRSGDSEEGAVSPARTRDPVGSRLTSQIRTRPLPAFVVLTFALSWAFWLFHYLTSSQVFFFFGGLGPLLAAAIVCRQRGTTRQWLARVLRWRVHPGYYVFAVLFPVLLYAAANGVALLLGAPLNLSLLDGVLPTYAATWATVTVLGGLEEPGWRGFALPHLQQSYSPTRSTLILGVVWGLWHLPVSPLAIVVTVPLAFFYTWLFNRTGSALLCLVLHASITPAQDHLRFADDNVTLQAAAVVTLVAAAVGFVVFTKGRLGAGPGRVATGGGVAG